MKVLTGLQYPGPGSFLEAVKLIPLLTKGAENQPAFDLVVPSLPNFGFSQGVKQVCPSCVISTCCTALADSLSMCSEALVWRNMPKRCILSC
jgi:hypothetical protein